MAEATRIRAQLSGSRAVVRVLMAHPMESGQRKDDSGRLVPAWYIEEVTAALNDAVVLTAEWGPAVSRDPYLQFTLRNAKAGDRVSITWLDNRGTRRTDEVRVAAEG